VPAEIDARFAAQFGSFGLDDGLLSSDLEPMLDGIMVRFAEARQLSRIKDKAVRFPGAVAGDQRRSPSIAGRGSSTFRRSTSGQAESGEVRASGSRMLPSRFLNPRNPKIASLAATSSPASRWSRMNSPGTLCSRGTKTRAVVRPGTETLRTSVADGRPTARGCALNLSLIPWDCIGDSELRCSSIRVSSVSTLVGKP
jgi:hypothetical protein